MHSQLSQTNLHLERFWGRITDAGKSVKDKGSYYQMLDSLAESIPSTYTGHRIEINRILVKLRFSSIL